jgi:hypothetical protein
MGGKSLKMHRIWELAKPVFRNRTSKVSIAFETMQVSIFRRAWSTCSSGNGVWLIRILERRQLTSWHAGAHSSSKGDFDQKRSSQFMKIGYEYRYRKKTEEDGGGRLYKTRLSMLFVHIGPEGTACI